MLADAMVYGLSLYAVSRAAHDKLRAAHVSGYLQLALALGALFEVARRFLRGSDPEPLWMMAVAAVALVANVACLVLITRHRHGGAHMKASYIFSTNDVIANLGVIGAGILVTVTGSRYPDLMIGAIIGALVLSGAVRILRLRT
jgi:Co/Zn/Cd efflux system component